VKDVPRRTPIHPATQLGPWDFSEPLHEKSLICLGNAFPLSSLAYEEAQARSSDIKRAYVSEADIVAVLSEDRECPSWNYWQQGFTPKEHREMIDRQRLLEFQTKREDDWQKFQTQMVADDKKWREEQEAKAELRYLEQEAKLEERYQREVSTLQSIHRSQMWIMGVIVTLIIVVTTLITTILGGAFEANWFDKWFGLWQEQTEQPIIPSVPDTQDVQPSEVL
jgi:hypothetical protein